VGFQRNTRARLLGFLLVELGASEFLSSTTREAVAQDQSRRATSQFDIVESIGLHFQRLR
jgi:hypothetical protein